ncbi:hypothetical protein ADL05_06685 [Nocardiopsis sp. NRRL B-16309]|nr:hypothetical protein ADL05_06685 [Nocardiopsis sp. NRRL B-16309]
MTGSFGPDVSAGSDTTASWTVRDLDGATTVADPADPSAVVVVPDAVVPPVVDLLGALRAAPAPEDRGGFARPGGPTAPGAPVTSAAGARPGACAAPGTPAVPGALPVGASSPPGAVVAPPERPDRPLGRDARVRRDGRAPADSAAGSGGLDRAPRAEAAFARRAGATGSGVGWESSGVAAVVCCMCVGPPGLGERQIWHTARRGHGSEPWVEGVCADSRIIGSRRKDKADLPAVDNDGAPDSTCANTGVLESDSVTR